VVCGQAKLRAAEADKALENTAGQRWKRVKRTIAFVTEVQKAAQRENEAEEHCDEFPGGIASLLRDVCDAAGFAFAEMWMRPKREWEDENGQTKVQWDYLLKFADVTYVNYTAFPEARNVAGKLDHFKQAARETTYAKNNSIPGLAWNRGALDRQDLSVYDVLDETLQADARTAIAMELFDASLALPIHHASYLKTAAVLVFYRNRHAAVPAALCHRPEYYKEEALLTLFAELEGVASVALEFDEAKPRFRETQEAFLHKHDGSIHEDASSAAKQDSDVYALPFLSASLDKVRRAVAEHERLKESLDKLSSMEKEWLKGRYASWLRTYIGKCKGTGAGPAPGTDYSYCKWVALGRLPRLLSTLRSLSCAAVAHHPCLAPLLHRACSSPPNPSPLALCLVPPPSLPLSHSPLSPSLSFRYGLVDFGYVLHVTCLLAACGSMTFITFIDGYM
jgi:hypothetical protein